MPVCDNAYKLLLANPFSSRVDQQSHLFPGNLSGLTTVLRPLPPHLQIQNHRTRMEIGAIYRDKKKGSNGYSQEAQHQTTKDSCQWMILWFGSTWHI